MRINVYAEELTDRVEVVTKRPANHPGETFYGIRLYLASPDELHVTPDDDDSSAITVWVPWTRSGGNDFARVERIFAALASATGAASEDDL
jgi:hypothetical protein